MDLLGTAESGGDPRGERSPDQLDDPTLKYKDPWSD
jgi:hypothetical protein